MFTGIIQEVGKVKAIRRKGGFVSFEVLCHKTLEGSVVGGSVAVNGVCLTVTSRKGFLAFDVVRNTLVNTALDRLRVGDAVNLENALKTGQDISGHIVSGHVDGERKVRKNMKSASGWTLEIIKLPEDSELVVTKGSVALDGVSLTVAENFADFFRVFLIPLTLRDTTLPQKKTGSFVNVEYDIMGKYASGKKRQGGLTVEILGKKGFI